MSLEATVAGSSNLVQDIVVFFSSMLPFIENKGSILLAAALNMKWYISYAETTIGSFLPVPFLIMVGKRGLQRLRRRGRLPLLRKQLRKAPREITAGAPVLLLPERWQRAGPRPGKAIIPDSAVFRLEIQKHLLFRTPNGYLPYRGACFLKNAWHAASGYGILKKLGNQLQLRFCGLPGTER